MQLFLKVISITKVFIKNCSSVIKGQIQIVHSWLKVQPRQQQLVKYT